MSAVWRASSNLRRNALGKKRASGRALLLTGHRTICERRLYRGRRSVETKFGGRASGVERTNPDVQHARSCKVIDELRHRGFFLDDDVLIAEQNARLDIVAAGFVVKAISKNRVLVGADLEVEGNPHNRMPLEAGELHRCGLFKIDPRMRGVVGQQLCARYRRAGNAIGLTVDAPVAGRNLAGRAYVRVARVARTQQ